MVVAELLTLEEMQEAQVQDLGDLVHLHQLVVHLLHTLEAAVAAEWVLELQVDLADQVVEELVDNFHLLLVLVELMDLVEEQVDLRGLHPQQRLLAELE